MMTIRALIMAGAFALTAACSTSSPEAAPSAPTTTTPPAPTTRKCADFPVSSFIGGPATRTEDIEGLGWKVEYSDVDNVQTKFDLNSATITNVSKYDPNCLASVQVRIKPTAPPAPSTPVGPLTSVSEGTYLVGTDMEAGSYKSPGGRGCYWARLKDDSGSNIIANNLGDGPARFTAKKGEYVEIARCTFTKV